MAVCFACLRQMYPVLRASSKKIANAMRERKSRGRLSLPDNLSRARPALVMSHWIAPARSPL